LMHAGPGKLFASAGTLEGHEATPSLFYKHKILPVDRLPELRDDFDKLKRSGKLSLNSTFQKYIQGMKFTVPDNFKEAKSIVMMAVFTRFMKVSFHLKGKTHDVIIPPQYYDDGVSPDQLKRLIQTNIANDPKARIESAEHLPLKLLAVRSGLGRYGRNNICFVDGMGSYLTLYAFLTDIPVEEDQWFPVEMMDACKKCKICFGICPTWCISRDRFVIDVDRCITLYNELEDPFPKWIQPRVHNALIGCMKCQMHCPVNMKIPNPSGRLEDVTEGETQKILQGTPDDALMTSLKRKLRDFYPVTSKKTFPMFTRNLSVLIR
ncbi:MAG TPA: 4Fe-4S double cluster binding domain-containing protein, partial [bacterium]